MHALRKLNDFDALAFFWCQRLLRRPSLKTLSLMVSRLGDGACYLFTGILLALLEPHDGAAFLQAGLTAFALELPLYLLLKNTIRRDRPCYRYTHFDAFITPSDKFSFPSGHAAAAFVFAGVLAHFYPSFSGIAYSLATLIGLSRVMLGVHYPADILAGAALGISCSGFTLLMLGV
jgi:undecaprenyl-diphosphatase